MVLSGECRLYFISSRLHMWHAYLRNSLSYSVKLVLDVHVSLSANVMSLTLKIVLRSGSDMSYALKGCH